MKWLKDVNDDLYDPTYTDMLRVAFTSEFGRGKLQDLVALLSGRNFETSEYEEAIAEESFAKLKEGIDAFMNKTHFDRLTMILRSSGFVTSTLIGSQNAVNFAYILYLRGRAEGLSCRRPRAPGAALVRHVDPDGTLLRQPRNHLRRRHPPDRGPGAYGLRRGRHRKRAVRHFLDRHAAADHGHLVGTSPYFIAYQAAQAQLGDKGFLSPDITVRDLLLNRGDKHHVFPRKHLKKQGLSRGRYNQIANFVIAQSEINIAIGDKAPETYFNEIAEQVNGGPKRYGGIVDRERLRENFAQNCLPASLLDGEMPEYDDFLAERRRLMALRIKEWFEVLS